MQFSQSKLIICISREYLLISKILLFFSVAMIFLTAGKTVVTTLAPFDTFILIDGAYRIFNGQIPHLDYVSPIGFFPQIILSIWFNIVGLNVSAVSYLQPTYAVIFIILFAGIAKERLDTFTKNMILSFIVLFTIAPCPVDVIAYRTGYCENYNRIGLACNSIACLFLLKIRIDQSSKTIIKDGFFYSVLICLQLGLKPNFFLASMVPLPVWLYYSRRFIAPALSGLITGFILMFFIPAILWGFSPYSMLRDFADVGSVVSNSSPSVWRLIVNTIKKPFIELNIWYVSLSILLIPFTYYYLISGQKSIKNRLQIDSLFIQISIISLFGVISNILCVIGMTRKTEATPVHIVVLGSLFSLLLTNIKSLEMRDDIFRIRTTILVFMVLLAPLPLLSNYLRDLTCCLITTRYKFNPKMTDGILEFESERLRKMHVMEWWALNNRNSLSDSYVEYINDGLRLIKSNYLNTNDSVFVISFSDPFSFALNLRPISHGYLWYHYLRNFNDQSRINFDLILNDADYVLVPVTFDHTDSLNGESSLVVFKRYYRATEEYLVNRSSHILKENYKAIGHSKYWELYRKTK